MLFLEAYNILSEVYFKGAHLKLALSAHLESGHGRTVKICYGVLEEDGYLTLCVKSVAERSPQAPVRLVLKIALYAMQFLDIPRAAAVNEAVELCKKIGKSGAAGFVNAALRKFDADKVTLPDGIEGLCVKSNFPAFAVRRIAEKYGSRAEGILLARSCGVSVRFVRGLEAYEGLPHTDTPFPDVKIFDRFVRDEGFFRGDYTFQSVGSVAICSVVEPCEELLDACAAPGGKSVLLANCCREVVACDLHAHRVKLIESYCKRMNAENVFPRQADSTQFEPAFEGAFDAVLVDAPCSGLGTVAENPDLPLRKEEASLGSLHALQSAILSNCARYVRPGGKLYYATCSLLPEENDGVVEEFLRAFPAFSAEKADCPLAHETTDYGLQFLPDTAFGAGFYVSKMRKA